MSMGWAAVRKLRRVVDNAIRVVAIEVMTAARAVELRRPLQPGRGHRRGGRRPALASYRDVGPDRFLAPEIDRTADLVRSGQILAWAESVTGPLQ